MKTSLAQSEASIGAPPINAQLLSSGVLSPRAHVSQSATASLELPSFDALSSVHSHSLRLAGRINAASVTEEERQHLLQERQSLLDKKFTGKITQSESNKLEYIRWSLDRIEDARHGAALDALDSSVSRYENFLSEIRSLQGQLRNLSKTKK